MNTTRSSGERGVEGKRGAHDKLYMTDPASGRNNHRAPVPPLRRGIIILHTGESRANRRVVDIIADIHTCSELSD